MLRTFRFEILCIRDQMYDVRYRNLKPLNNSKKRALEI